MFLPTRPTSAEIDRFLANSADLSLSYEPVHILDAPNAHAPIHEAVATLGRGRNDFIRACDALRAWTQFDIGWVELHPRGASIDVGTNVAVLIRHLGFWSLNGCRVVYHVGDGETRFGYAYGTLPTQAEAGEELFAVTRDPSSDAVTYRIRATSWPNALLARIGLPIARHLQERFRRDSIAAMRRTVPA